MDIFIPPLYLNWHLFAGNPPSIAARIMRLYHLECAFLRGFRLFFIMNIIITVRGNTRPLVWRFWIPVPSR